MQSKKYKYNKFQKAWLKALESDEYLQTTSLLASYDPLTKAESFCCLGVACEVYNDLASKAKRKKIPKKSTHRFGSPCFSYDDVKTALPNKVLSALKLISPSGVILNDKSISLANMNDSGMSHKAIARYIRKNPENVFIDS